LEQAVTARAIAPARASILNGADDKPRGRVRTVGACLSHVPLFAEDPDQRGRKAPEVGRFDTEPLGVMTE
jgi:hypothetical protein